MTILNVTLLRSKLSSCNVAHRTIFSATFRCGNLLQVFESDSKTYNNVACCRILLELVRVTPSSLTFNATSRHISARSSSTHAQDDVALKIVPCNILLSQQCCVKSCLMQHGLKIVVKNRLV